MIFITRNKNRFRRLAACAGSALFWLCVWQWVYVSAGQEILVASPAEVLLRLLELAGQAAFWMTVACSMGRIVSGFLLGALLGTAAAVLTEWSAVGNALLRPAVEVMRATPVASFIILALVWMKTSHVPVFACAVIVLPIVWENVSEGIRKTDRNLLQMGRMYGFGKWGTIRRIYAPSVLPYFTAACTTGMGMAWKGGVAAEVLSALLLSIGGAIYDSKIYLETVDLFAWTAAVILFSVLLERLLISAVRAAGKRYGLYFGSAEHEH